MHPERCPVRLLVVKPQGFPGEMETELLGLRPGQTEHQPRCTCPLPQSSEEPLHGNADSTCSDIRRAAETPKTTQHVGRLPEHRGGTPPEQSERGGGVPQPGDHRLGPELQSKPPA